MLGLQQRQIHAQEQTQLSVSQRFRAYVRRFFVNCEQMQVAATERQQYAHRACWLSLSLRSFSHCSIVERCRATIARLARMPNSSVRSSELHAINELLDKFDGQSHAQAPALMMNTIHQQQQRQQADEDDEDEQMASLVKAHIEGKPVRVTVIQ